MEWSQIRWRLTFIAVLEATFFLVEAIAEWIFSAPLLRRAIFDSLIFHILLFAFGWLAAPWFTRLGATDDRNGIE